MSKARNLADLLNNSGQITAEIPSQTGQSGKYLSTDGSTASWENIGTTFPFYKADGNSDTITITSGVFPFYKADGSQDNIGTS